MKESTEILKDLINLSINQSSNQLNTRTQLPCLNLVAMEAMAITSESEEVSFQLAVLDDNGGLSIWNVVELLILPSL